MRKILAGLIVFVLVLLSFPSILSAAPPINAGLFPDSAPDRILVQFRPGASLPQTAEVHRQLNGKVKETIPGIGVQVVEVPRGQAMARVRAYASHPLVQYAEPDFLAEVAGTPDDPGFANQWGMVKVQAPEAWEVTTGSSGINIAILDTGIDLDHPDLAAKIVGSRNFTGSATADDIHGHGTHVAGIAAAVTNNGIGVAGLGYDSSIMNVKVLGDDGRGYHSWIAQGITWAADNGAHVINMSLGGTSASSTMENAVNYAWNRGVLVVAAAGNNGNTVPFYPAYYDNCMAVAGTDQYDRLASWSNRGDWVSVAAPGVGIVSTVINGGYSFKSGTSMASPHVAGLAALTFTVVSDSNGNGRLNDEVRSRIEASCDDIGVTGIGAGRINAHRAVEGGSPPPAPTTGGIAGKVTDAADGSPVAGAAVSCGGATVTTDFRGEYAMTGLVQGAHTLSVSATGYAGASRSVSIIAGETARVDIVLDKLPPTTGSISGRVTNGADGSAISGATVRFNGVSARTDSKGEYAITNLPEGAETISVSATGYIDASQTAEIVAGEVSEVNFALDKLPPPPLREMWVEAITFRVTGVNMGITVHVVDDQGALPGAQVWLVVTNGSRSWHFSGVTDSTGSVGFTISKGPAGTYVATVSGLSADGYQWDLASGVISVEHTVQGKNPKK